jgi:hypothetical protein
MKKSAAITTCTTHNTMFMISLLFHYRWLALLTWIA